MSVINKRDFLFGTGAALVLTPPAVGVAPSNASGKFANYIDHVGYILYDYQTSGTSSSGVATINALRSTAVVNSVGLTTLGYYAAGDGGGNFFYGVTGASPGTYVDNGGSIIIPTGGNGSAAWLQVGRTYNVNQFGAFGDGVTDYTTQQQNCINAATDNVPKNYGEYNQSRVYWPGGVYILSSPLQLYAAVGVVFEGAGRFSTTLKNPSGTGIFNTNGCGWCVFQHMQLYGASGSDILFNLDWQGTAGTISVQGNTFFDMYFQSAAQGVQIGISGLGPGGYQADTTTFINCGGDSLSVAGISCNNFNSLAHNVYGGIWSRCGIGVWVQEGSISVISGVGFEHNTWDIQIDASANDCYQISGCRTESLQFINAQRGNLDISGCEQSTNHSAKIFAQIGFHPCKLTSCISDNGQLKSINGDAGFVVENCEFGNTNWTANSKTYGFVKNSYAGGPIDHHGASKLGAEWFFRGTGTETRLYTPVLDSIAIQTSNYTLTNSTSIQKIFAVTGNGSAFLPISAYLIEAVIHVTRMAASSGIAEISLIGAGTATMANALWVVEGIDPSNATMPQALNGSVVAGDASGASAVIATTGTSSVFRLRGSFQITTAGTVIPSIALVNASAAVLQAGSYIKFQPLSSGFVNGVTGNWS
jgi:hypothetical protein